MKKSNARLGMKVQIKDGAWLVEDNKVGDVLNVTRLTPLGMWLAEKGKTTGDAHFYTYNEVRKVKGHAYL